MRALEVIDADILSAQNELANMKVPRCECYSRIVGYYRAVSNWNPGKTDEFGKRVMFNELSKKAEA